MSSSKKLFNKLPSEKKAEIIRESIEKAIREFIDTEGGFSRELICRAVERTFHNYDLDGWWDTAKPQDFGRALSYLLEYCEREELLNDDTLQMRYLPLYFSQDILPISKELSTMCIEFSQLLSPNAKLDDIEGAAIKYIEMLGAVHYLHQGARPDLSLRPKEDTEQSDQLKFKCSNELKEHPEFVDYLFDELSTRGSGFFPDIHWIDSNKCNAEDLKFVLGFSSQPKDFKKIAWTYRENKGVSKQRLFELMEALGYSHYVIKADQGMLPDKKNQIYQIYNNCITFEGIKAVSRQDFKKGADYSPDCETKNLIKSAIEKYERNTKCSMDELRVHLGI